MSGGGTWRGIAAAISAGAVASLSLAIWPKTSSISHASAPHPEQPSVNDGDKLKLVQVVFRHGARTPLSKHYWPELVAAWDVCGQLYDPVPLDVLDENGGPRPINSHDAAQMATVFNGGCHKGELTREGQHQARNFGRWLRQRYVQALGFLPGEYVQGLLYGRTTNYSRTVATLQGVLTGLFPDHGKIPIPVHTTEEMDEILFGNPESCKKLKALIKQTASEANEAVLTAEVKALQERVRKAMGLEGNDDRIKFLDLHDAMTTMQTHGKPIPEGMRDPELLQAVENQATQRFLKFIVGSSEGPGEPSELLRLGMGRLMHFLVQRMEESTRENTSNGKESPKFFLYSGHDSTIIPLLAALGQPVDHWPTYLSNLVFELWEKPNGEHYVQVLYNREPLNMENTCGKAHCSLKTLRHQVLGPYLLTKKERQAECLVHFSHDKPAGTHVKEVAVGSSMSEE